MRAEPADPVVERFVCRIAQRRNIVPVKGQLREQQQHRRRQQRNADEVPPTVM